MKDKFIEKDGLLFLMCEPEPLEMDSEMPCLAHLIQDDSRMGILNKEVDSGFLLDNIVVNGLCSGYVATPGGNTYYIRLEIIAKPCPEGSNDWALYQMMRGKIVYHKKSPSIMYCENAGYIKRKVRYGCVDHMSVSVWLNRVDKNGWQIYTEPKPLLADAKEGWLVINRAGHTSTIKYIDNNNGVLKYAYEVSDGTTIYVRENGMFNIINHNSNYDIVSAEPLAPEGSADWAWQMLMLGIPVSHPAEGEFQDTDYTKEGFVRCMAKTGWQIYKEPEPEVGKWYINKPSKKYYQHDSTSESNGYRFRQAGSTIFDMIGNSCFLEEFELAPIEPDFSNAKVGDECYSSAGGACRIIRIDRNDKPEITVNCGDNKGYYHLNGKFVMIDIHPTLFHSAAQCAAYFAEVALKERGEQC